MITDFTDAGTLGTIQAKAADEGSGHQVLTISLFALVASGSGRAADRPFVGGQRPFGAPRMTLPD